MENHWKANPYLSKASVQEDDAKNHFPSMKTGYFKRLWRLSRSNHGFRRSSTYQVTFACNATHSMGATTTLQNKTRKIPKTNKKKPPFHIMASPKCQNSELIRRIPVVALEPQHDEELRHKKHATLKVLLPNFWGCSGLELPIAVSGC